MYIANMHDVLLGNVLNNFREQSSTIINDLCDILKEAMQKLDPEKEFHEYLSELTSYLEALSIGSANWSGVTNAFITSLSWDNFKTDDEEDSKYFTLGEMYWNKFQWIIEGVDYDDDFTNIIRRLQLSMPAYLDHLEKTYATTV